MLDIYQELTAIVNTLACAEIDYALCGGIAVAFHGYTRFTRNIDILIKTEDLARVLTAVRPCGFELDAGKLPFDLGTPQEQWIHRISKAEGKDMLTLDLVLVSPILQDVWDDRTEFEWQEQRLWVVSATGLAKMKQLAGRDQDKLDLIKLGFTNNGQN